MPIFTDRHDVRGATHHQLPPKPDVQVMAQHAPLDVSEVQVPLGEAPVTAFYPHL